MNTREVMLPGSKFLKIKPEFLKSIGQPQPIRTAYIASSALRCILWKMSNPGHFAVIDDKRGA
jgi:hypothetical protein